MNWQDGGDANSPSHKSSMHDGGKQSTRMDSCCSPFTGMKDITDHPSCAV